MFSMVMVNYIYIIMITMMVNLKMVNLVEKDITNGAQLLDYIIKVNLRMENFMVLEIYKTWMDRSRDNSKEVISMGKSL